MKNNIENRFEKSITRLSTKQLRAVEIALLEISAYGEIKKTLDIDACLIIDNILKY